MSHNYLTIDITEERDGLKIYQILKNRLHFSAEKIRSMKFDPEGIFLNGEHATVNAPLHPGDQLRLLLDDSENRKLHILPNPAPLKILYEDRDLLAVDKPAGMVCHPSKGHLTDSLANFVRAYFDKTDEYANIHFVGRLDKETSGVVLIAKNGAYADWLQSDKQSENFIKTYLALAEGTFEKKAGTITIPMQECRDPQTGILLMTNGGKDGKPAETRYEVLSEKGGYSVLLITIKTGRMHQIRFHMAETGHPLLCDPLYGHQKKTDLIGRTALHALSLEFIDPLTKEKIFLKAEPPEDFQTLL